MKGRYNSAAISRLENAVKKDINQAKKLIVSDPEISVVVWENPFLKTLIETE